MSEARLLLEYKDYQDEDEQGIPKKKTTWLSHSAFMSRFVRHILPSGYQRIRYTGIWASSNRKRKLAKCQQLLGVSVIRMTMSVLRAVIMEKLGIQPDLCPCCGSSDIGTYIVSPKGNLTLKSIANLSNRAPPIALPKAS